MSNPTLFIFDCNLDIGDTQDKQMMFGNLVKSGKHVAIILQDQGKYSTEEGIKEYLQQRGVSDDDISKIQFIKPISSSDNVQTKIDQCMTKFGKEFAEKDYTKVVWISEDISTINSAAQLGCAESIVASMSAYTEKVAALAKISLQQALPSAAPTSSSTTSSTTATTSSPTATSSTTISTSSTKQDPELIIFDLDGTLTRLMKGDTCAAPLFNEQSQFTGSYQQTINRPIYSINNLICSVWSVPMPCDESGNYMWSDKIPDNLSSQEKDTKKNELAWQKRFQYEAVTTNAKHGYLRPNGDKEKWRDLFIQLIQAGKKVAIASFGAYPYAVLVYLKEVLDVPDDILAKIKIASWLPPKPDTMTKEQHIATLMLDYGLDPEKLEDRQKVLLVDDTERHITAAAQAGCQTIFVEDNKNGAHIQKVAAIALPTLMTTPVVQTSSTTSAVLPNVQSKVEDVPAALQGSSLFVAPIMPLSTSSSINTVNGNGTQLPSTDKKRTALQQLKAQAKQSMIGKLVPTKYCVVSFPSNAYLAQKIIQAVKDRQGNATKITDENVMQYATSQDITQALIGVEEADDVKAIVISGVYNSLNDLEKQHGDQSTNNDKVKLRFKVVFVVGVYGNDNRVAIFPFPTKWYGDKHMQQAALCLEANDERKMYQFLQSTASGCIVKEVNNDIFIQDLNVKIKGWKNDKAVSADSTVVGASTSSSASSPTSSSVSASVAVFGIYKGTASSAPSMTSVASTATTTSASSMYL